MEAELLIGGRERGREGREKTDPQLPDINLEQGTV